MGVDQNYIARVTQDLVFGSICQDAIAVHVFDPQPNKEPSSWVSSFHPESAATVPCSGSSDLLDSAGMRYRPCSVCFCFTVCVWFAVCLCFAACLCFVFVCVLCLFVICVCLLFLFVCLFVWLVGWLVGCLSVCLWLGRPVNARFFWFFPPCNGRKTRESYGFSQVSCMSGHYHVKRGNYMEIHTHDRHARSSAPAQHCIHAGHMVSTPEPPHPKTVFLRETPHPTPFLRASGSPALRPGLQSQGLVQF